MWGLIFEEEAAQNQMGSPSSNCGGPEASKETVAVSVSDGNENVAVKTDSQTVQSTVGLVGEVLGGVDQMISSDPVLNQVVNETVNEVVDEVYEEVVNDVCDEVVDEVFDEIIDEGLGGLFGILH